jgi:undecaprenyl-diphosphatase
MVTLVLIAGGIWFFLEIADLAMQQKTIAFDQQVLRALRQSDTPSLPLGPAWLVNAVRDVTALGGYTLLTLLTILVSLYLGLKRKLRLMLLSSITITGGTVVSSTLKIFFARERPEIDHLVDVTTKSFPSGHAMLSTVVYLTLAILLTQTTPRNSIKMFFIGSALLLSLMVGTSRVYLGVHFPTDVIAGWIAGSVWVMVCFLVAGRIQSYHPKTSHNSMNDTVE